ncbi:uncharacterized protein DS421_17g582470 [Arachis hypogaea]|nr:uncharacterized protein DS421_17g582470 [Arachis hypogaea]
MRSGAQTGRFSTGLTTVDRFNCIFDSTHLPNRPDHQFTGFSVKLAGSVRF